MLPTATQLHLCFDGGADPNGLPDWGEPDVLVEYSVVDGKLVRLDRSTGVQLALADYISNFTVQNVGETGLRLFLEVRRAGLTRSVTLMWTRPA